MEEMDEQHFHLTISMCVSRYILLFNFIKFKLETFSHWNSIDTESRLTRTLMSVRTILKALKFNGLLNWKYLAHGCSNNHVLAWTHKIGTPTVRKVVYEIYFFICIHYKKKKKRVNKFSILFFFWQLLINIWNWYVY